MSEETVTFNLELNVEHSYTQLRRVELLLFRTLGILNRLGLPENVTAVISKVQRLIMVVRMLHTALIALEAASGPLGWALAAEGMIMGALSAVDLVQSVGE